MTGQRKRTGKIKEKGRHKNKKVICERNGQRKVTVKRKGRVEKFRDGDKESIDLGEPQTSFYVFTSIKTETISVYLVLFDKGTPFL